MRIALDLDGCIFNFNPAYITRILEVTGVDRFEGRVPGTSWPDTWSYPEALGYSGDDMSRVWRSIRQDRGFWLNLEPLPGAAETLARLTQLRVEGHDIYFITTRPGAEAKRQSEMALSLHGMEVPTVLICEDKATALRILALDAYIDDRLLNANSCMAEVRRCDMRSRVYLLHAPYNDRPVAEPVSGSSGITGEQRRDVGLKVVGSVGEMLREEGLL